MVKIFLFLMDCSEHPLWRPLGESTMLTATSGVLLKPQGKSQFTCKFGIRRKDRALQTEEIVKFQKKRVKEHTHCSSSHKVYCITGYVLLKSLSQKQNMQTTYRSNSIRTVNSGRCERLLITLGQVT
jgi:hypothetical protein